MIERGKQEIEQASRAAKIYRPAEDPFVMELSKQVKDESDLLQSYNQISSEIDTALKLYGEKVNNFKKQNQHMEEKAKSCEILQSTLQTLKTQFDNRVETVSLTEINEQVLSIKSIW